MDRSERPRTCPPFLCRSCDRSQIFGRRRVHRRQVRHRGPHEGPFDVGVAARRLEVRVPEQLADHVEPMPAAAELGRSIVAQIVEVQIDDAGALDGAMETAGDRVEGVG